MSRDVEQNETVQRSIAMLESWIESRIAYRQQPGLAIGILHDKRLIWSRGFGMADMSPHAAVTPRTLFRIASITKLFTATSILQLRDRGVLQLDDPIVKHLPAFSFKDKHDYSPRVTIRHLLTHTSGLPREAGSPYWVDNEFPSREEIEARLETQPSIFPREHKWKYSNLAWTIAGWIVEKASGEPYEDYVRSRILEPLEMSETLVGSSESASLVSGYGSRLPNGIRESRPFTRTGGITPAAGMSSSVEDLARFVAFQQAAHDSTASEDSESSYARTLHANTRREMHRVHWLEPEWQAGWGLGFRILRADNRTRVGHGGALQGYRSGIDFCPKEKLGVVALTNSDDGDPHLFIEQVYKIVGPAIAEATKKPKPTAAPKPEWQSYVGKYRSVWGDLEVLDGGTKLLAVAPTEVEIAAAAVELRPLDDGTFRLVGTSGYQSLGEIARFERGEDGAVIRVWIGEVGLDRLSEW